MKGVKAVSTGCLDGISLLELRSGARELTLLQTSLFSVTPVKVFSLLVEEHSYFPLDPEGRWMVSIQAYLQVYPITSLFSKMIKGIVNSQLLAYQEDHLINQ